jgi:hypothetical protein
MREEEEKVVDKGRRRKRFWILELYDGGGGKSFGV